MSLVQFELRKTRKKNCQMRWSPPGAWARKETDRTDEKYLRWFLCQEKYVRICVRGKICCARGARLTCFRCSRIGIEKSRDAHLIVSRCAYEEKQKKILRKVSPPEEGEAHLRQRNASILPGGDYAIGLCKNRNGEQL